MIISTNENDEVPVYWRTGSYKTIVPSKNCISSAMNVGHPSNMARDVSLYGGVMAETGNITAEPDVEQMHKDIFAVSISDAQTTETLKATFSRYQVITEPHGAAGWAGLMQYYAENPSEASDRLAVCLETAHPAKFPEEIQRLLGIDPPLPASLKGLDDLEESFDKLNLD